MLIDISQVPECCTDHALETLHKALAGEPGLSADIWAEHENPFIRDLIERFTERGLTKIAKVQAELGAWAAGQYHVPSMPKAPTPAGFLGRWTQEQLDLARIYLQSIPPGEMTLADWSLAVDYMVQRYMPAETLVEEAEWLTTKAQMMGAAQAHLGAVEAGVAASLVSALPETAAEAWQMFRLTDAARAVMEYGRLRAGEALQGVSEGLRHGVKSVVLAHEARRMAGEPVTTGELQQALLDRFDAANRDWRRVALTEAGEMENQGVVASLAPGARVRRMEMYRGACPFCRKLDGRIFRVTGADDPGKDGERDVWPGKSNLGRSASPRKRVGGELIERDAAERWWAPAGTVHPHCRGRWEPVKGAAVGDDPAFAEWLRKRLGQVEGMQA